MCKPILEWKPIVRVVLVLGMLCIPSPVLSESLKDAVIMRDDAKAFLKDGSCIPCNRIVWLVSAADYIQCDKGDHAVEIKLADLNFEKTFGPALAREYAARKDDLADAHEESRKKQEAGTVTYETPTVKKTEKVQAPKEGPPAPLEPAAGGDATEGDASVSLDAALETMSSDPSPLKVYKAVVAINKKAMAGEDCTRAIAPLIEHLGDERSVMVTSTGGGFGGGSTYSRSVGYAAKSALVNMGSPAVPALIQRVKERRPGSEEVGDQLAVVALGEIKDARAVEVLVQQAQQPGGLVFKRNTVRALGQIKGPEAWEGLVTIVGSQKGLFRREAARGLYHMDPKRAPAALDPYIDALLAEADAKSLASVVNLAGNCAFERLTPTFVGYLRHGDHAVVSYALYGLEKVGAPAEALPRILELAAVARHKEHATRAIRAMRDPAATARLIQCVNHSDATVRQASIQALGEIGRAEAVPALARALADPDQGARVAAVWALGSIPGPESTAALQEAARSEDPNVGIPARARLRRRAAGN